MCIWRTHFCIGCKYGIDIPYLCPWNKDGKADYRFCHAQYGLGQINKQILEAVRPRDLTHVCADGTPYTGLWNEGDIWNQHVRVVESMRWRRSQRRSWMDEWRDSWNFGVSSLSMKSEWWKRKRHKWEDHGVVVFDTIRRSQKWLGLLDLMFHSFVETVIEKVFRWTLRITLTLMTF